MEAILEICKPDHVILTKKQNENHQHNKTNYEGRTRFGIYQKGLKGRRHLRPWPPSQLRPLLLWPRVWCTAALLRGSTPIPPNTVAGVPPAARVSSSVTSPVQVPSELCMSCSAFSPRRGTCSRLRPSVSLPRSVVAAVRPGLVGAHCFILNVVPGTETIVKCMCI